MVHAHEIKELKLKVVKAALLLYRSGALLSPVTPVNNGKNTGTTKGRKNGNKKGQKGQEGPEKDLTGAAPVCECRVCWRGFGNAVDREKHVCVVNSAVLAIAGIEEDGTRGGAVVGGVDESELTSAVREEEVGKVGEVRQWYQKLWKGKGKEGESGNGSGSGSGSVRWQEEKEEEERKWQEEEEEAVVVVEMDEEEEKLLLSDLIQRLQMVKTNLLLADSHKSGFKIDRALRKINKRSKALNDVWQTNIGSLVQRYLNELDDMMYHVVATGKDAHGQRSNVAADASHHTPHNSFLSSIAMPRLVHRQSTLHSELPLAHVVHNMRNIDYEISVYSDLSSAVLGYRLVFLAESGDGHNYELVR